MLQIDDLSQELDDRGVVKLEGFIAPKKVETARDLIMDLAKEHGVYSERQWASSASRFGYPKSLRNALNGLNRDEKFPRLIDKNIMKIVECLVGQSVVPLSPGQQILFSLPCLGDWSVPADAWHTDMPRYGVPSYRDYRLSLFSMM
ncbi:MAG: hypothetical protein AAFN04_10585 [Pseudomonadota bacterium]